ncbi:hypothetical protein NDU88_006017 [Pleurodeles waltl]|uniref:Uncharacterized protein n=1 Tax=Pleurodeles waltl TaxID=8319 RepID=A0AAV7MZ76_PLEWA|nr:hypothetical protein NDU88_006017 [Pleurodeles waltl]
MSSPRVRVRPCLAVLLEHSEDSPRHSTLLGSRACSATHGEKQRPAAAEAHKTEEAIWDRRLCPGFTDQPHAALRYEDRPASEPRRLVAERPGATARRR